MAEIPMVDFSSMCLNVIDDDQLDPVAVQGVSQQLANVFSTTGFVYLTNTAMPDSLLESVYAMAKKFFALPVDVKRKHAYNVLTNNHGWVASEQESVDINKPGDLKECFNVTWDGLVQEGTPIEGMLPEVLIEFYRVCTRLAHRVLKAIAIGLKLENTKFLMDCHNTLTRNGGTTMRMLIYPPVPPDVQPGQTRLGEHCDYGSLTLLFQDNIGGLQVRARDNEWIDARPISGTVLVNLGDLMQRWTSDRLVSTPHRVLISADDVQRKSVRQSVAFFFHPDDDVLVTCLDDSEKYEPITAGEFLARKLAASYNY